MTGARPTVGDSILVDGETWVFSGVPSAPSIVYAEPGRKAKVYRLAGTRSPAKKALKVFYPQFRTSESDGLLTERTSEIGARFSEIYSTSTEKSESGLAVAERLVITRDRFPEVVDRYEGLENSILMDWMEGESWSNIVAGREALSRDQCIQLGHAFITTLVGLEERGIAHCDLSSGNFVIQDGQRIHLVDIEDLYLDGLDAPSPLPACSSGYVPAWVHKRGLWNRYADRYAGAILLCEMLGWHYDDIREIRDGSSFFAHCEPGHPGSKRIDVLAGRLDELDPDLKLLLERVWKADDIDACPSLTNWKEVVESISRDSPTCDDCGRPVNEQWGHCPFCGQELGRKFDDGVPVIGIDHDFLQFGELGQDESSGKATVQVKIWNQGQGVLVGKVSSVPWIQVSQPTFLIECSQDPICIDFVLQARHPDPGPGSMFRFPSVAIIEASTGEHKVLGGSYSIPRKGLWRILKP